MDNLFKTMLRRSRTFAIVEDNVYDIPQRLREIDPSYFVVYNSTADKFEVHSSENIGSSYCFTVPYDELDYRTIEYARKTSIKLHGTELIDKIFDDNEKEEEKKKKEYKEDLKDRAREVQPIFKDLAWEMGL